MNSIWMEIKTHFIKVIHLGKIWFYGCYKTLLLETCDTITALSFLLPRVVTPEWTHLVLGAGKSATPLGLKLGNSSHLHSSGSHQPVRITQTPNPPAQCRLFVD